MLSMSTVLRAMRFEAALRRAAYAICERLDGYADQTTTMTKLVAADVAAALAVLDIDAALSAKTLPPAIEDVMKAVSPDEWREIRNLSRFVQDYMGDWLSKPEWQHLRAPAR